MLLCAIRTTASSRSRCRALLSTASTFKMDRPIEPKATRLGWIGTGVMGTSMVGHLIAAGYETTVFNRSPSKTLALAAKGATVAASPAEVASRSDIVFVIVGFPSDVREVVCGESGVLSTLRPGGIVVDMTTSEPSLAEEIERLAKSRGQFAVDAPVSGGDIGAKNATLSIMVGGDAAVVTHLNPFFALMGKNIKHLGPAGRGQHTKMMNQILIASNMIGVVESLLYASKAGLNLDQAIEAVGAGAAGSWSINNLGPRIVKNNFDPGFFVEHFIKDLGIALSEAKRMGIALPGLALAHQLYVATQAQGHGRMGTQSLYLALETMNGIKR